MSIAREVQAGFELGMECAAISLITNRAAGLTAGRVNHAEVLATAAGQILRLAALLDRFLESL
jgi:purine nucleoside phosphorylase